MHLIDLTGLTLAFMGTMPPPRPPRRQPDGPTWAAALLIGGVCLAMVGPMFTIWSFHRPRETAKARCVAAGGRFAYGALDGSGPYRCEPAGHGTGMP